MSLPRGVFLDRDGVVVEDVGLVTRYEQLRVLPGVPQALARLARAGFRLFLATNQSVVARGLVTEAEVEQVHRRLCEHIVASGGPRLDACYFCPHHPQAEIAAYREECSCRKPRPGMLLRGAAEFGLRLADSFMIGDRMTDIAAGHRAGCRTILVRTGQHEAPSIVTVDPVDPSIQPDHDCPDLGTATDWILGPPPKPTVR